MKVSYQYNGTSFASFGVYVSNGGGFLGAPAAPVGPNKYVRRPSLPGRLGGECRVRPYTGTWSLLGVGGLKPR